ncbi:sulfur carrier protein ThiS [Citrobacter amalonaticus]|nr:sulfur carrier protein ThiS [Citrobacter amalonaticus]
MQCAEGLSVHTLLIQLNQLTPGTALALNQQILPREQWDQHIVQEGDQILLFQVIAGGLKCYVLQTKRLIHICSPEQENLRRRH